MGRVRQSLKPVVEGKQLIARFLHPISKKTTRVPLEDGEPAKTNLEWLNKIFLNEDHWNTLPGKTPEHIKKAWLGKSYGVRLTDKRVNVNGTRRDSDDARKMRIEIARLSAVVDALNGQITDFRLN